jgi:hypothetical protein
MVAHSRDSSVDTVTTVQAESSRNRGSIDGREKDVPLPQSVQTGCGATRPHTQ